MVMTLHRIFDRLFGDPKPDTRPLAPQPPRPEPVTRRGIPDGYLDKVPPPEEREGIADAPAPA